MKIDRNLNLVVEIPREGEPSVFAHSQAISADIVEQYFQLAGPTMNALVQRGFGLFAPRYAATMLKEVAIEQAAFAANANLDDEKQMAAIKVRADRKTSGLMAEIHRVTHVVALAPSGWEFMPIGDAKASALIDDEEFSQVENAVVFFTFGLRSYVKEQREAVAGGLSLSNARIVSFNCTEFMRSLPTLTKGANSGERKAVSPASSDGSPGQGSTSQSAASTSRGLAFPHIEIVSPSA